MNTQIFKIKAEDLEKAEAIVLKNVASKIAIIENDLNEDQIEAGIPDSLLALSEFDGGESQRLWDNHIGEVLERIYQKLSIIPEAERLARLEYQYFTCGLTGILGEVFTPIFEMEYNW
jgi:hypothetical protein